ncbi:chymotrypsin-1-like [Uloborus diversus]|uniref:chymotrypsin-1-like n=1 Tax=Uloborus diversus TaxID=327109 RepID=UPI0024093D26|nr:chymotrypsin-1-like [Uloborus diversus]
MLRCQTVTVLLVVILQVTTVTVHGAPEESQGHEAERIVGGQDAEQGMYPWTVALFYNNQFICTASVISPTNVMTAAHCVVFEGVVQPAESFYGIAGNVNKSSPVYRVNFATVTPHPEYENLDNDVAIFRTTEPIPISDELRPICIAAADSDAEYTTALIMGWGRTNRVRILPTRIPDILQWGNQRIVPNEQCGVIYGGAVDENKICATGRRTGVCNGDSGGPLVHMRDDTPIQIGVTSFVNALIGCGKTFGPAAFTRVSRYNEFIMSNADNVCVE